MPHLRVVGIILAAGLFSRDVSARPPREANQDAIVVRECLVVDSVGRRGRSAFRADAIEAQFVAGTWRAPRAGDTVTLPDGQTRSWRPATADAAGWFEGRAFDGGYACAVARSDSDKAMLLHAQGHSMARVNGAPRAGDPYSTGYVLTPIQLHKGDNVLLFRCGRGKLRIELLEPDAPALLNAKDATLPDLVVGQAVDQWAAVVAINATDSPLEGLAIHASFGNDRRSTTTPIPPLLPHGVRKAAFRISGTAPRETGDLVLRLELLRNADRAGEALDSTTATLHVRSPEKARKRTFFSGIDGSLQYYAELPPWPPASDAARPPALFLSLHGAAVEAIRQAGSYSNKSWGWLVAPTNRRPYGFDWEDWGRLDALQVLDTAIRGLGVDPTRVYLTGHSMGGHGAWHLGVTFPDRFAAVGPSAGWISMFSYARMAREPASSPVQDILARCMLPSDTEALARNLAPLGVYILHGQDDDNVPVREAR
ncbi:MAG: alpha/beta hydrolase-fold protein, partial [Candidatus Sumerlaeota bacterium]|nr:alpha/beta hydrolase-fold protein [Candidatus Sumerlaeota bacterium]